MKVGSHKYPKRRHTMLPTYGRAFTSSVPGKWRTHLRLPPHLLGKARDPDQLQLVLGRSVLTSKSLRHCLSVDSTQMSP